MKASRGMEAAEKERFIRGLYQTAEGRETPTSLLPVLQKTVHSLMSQRVLPIEVRQSFAN